MGNSPKQRQNGISIDKFPVALIVTGQSNRVIEYLRESEYGKSDSKQINYHADTLLHYAAAKEDRDTIEFLLNSQPDLIEIPNADEKYAADMTSNVVIREIFRKHTEKKTPK